MRVAILLLAGLVAFAAAERIPVPRVEERIVGGNPTNIQNYPFAAALLHSSNLVTFWQACGGTIINNRSIMSAAHCFFGGSVNQWRCRTGSTNGNSGGIVHNVALLILHPQYNNNNLDNDMALMRVSGTISFNVNSQPASIAGPNYNLADNQVVWAIGWGAISFGGPSSEQLRHVQIWTVNQVICRNRYAQLGWPITDNMLCSGWLDVGGRDQCQGDSGGPLIHNNVIVGVCSFGYQCALAQFPGVNARVSRYTAWIQGNA